MVASALTAEAILGVAIALHGSSPEHVIVQARVTLEETVQIPALSKREVTARINKLL